jgi:hypothetical protein
MLKSDKRSSTTVEPLLAAMMRMLMQVWFGSVVGKVEVLEVAMEVVNSGKNVLWIKADYLSRGLFARKRVGINVEPEARCRLSKEHMPSFETSHGTQRAALIGCGEVILQFTFRIQARAWLVLGLESCSHVTQPRSEVSSLFM